MLSFKLWPLYPKENIPGIHRIG